MTTLPTQSFATIVANIAAGVQGRAAKFINFSKGSTLLAIAEGFAGVFLWFQALVLQLLTATRLSTSSGTDVDTWTGDWMPAVPGTTSPRLGVQFATGLLTFTRLTAAPSTCFIPAAKIVNADGTFVNAGPSPAATVRSTDGTQNFVVTANVANTAYSSVLGGYTLASMVASLDVSAQALAPGSAGNVSGGAISVMTSTIPGIDTVTNAAAFKNGSDSESDNSLKSRFQYFIQSLQKATEGAIAFAISSVQVGMQWQIWENIDPDGSTDYGAFTVYVDDGSGAIAPATLSAAQAAVFSIAAAGTRPQVLASTVLLANVVMGLTTDAAYDHNAVIAQVVTAVGGYINGVGLGQVKGGVLVTGTLSYIKVGAVAIGVPGVLDVTGFTINGVAADLVPARGRVIKAGTLVVS